MSKSSPVSVRLQPAINEQLTAIAEALDRSKSWVIEQAVKDYVALDAWRQAGISRLVAHGTDEGVDPLVARKVRSGGTVVVEADLPNLHRL